MKKFKLKEEILDVGFNESLEEIIARKLNNASFKELENNLIIIQIGSYEIRMPQQEIDKIVLNSQNYLIQRQEDNLKGICTHNCLSFEAYRY